MSIKQKLAIYLITYNRKKKLRETLDTILAPDSPIRDFGITILDNASTDGSSELIDLYCQKYSNLTHIRYNINIGGNANACRAFEIGASCGKEYMWVLCDDDKYDFSNWKEVENKVNGINDIICVSDYVFPKPEEKKNPAYQLFQLSFIPAGIYKTQNITSSVLMNMYDGIITMFPQACLSIKMINEKGKISILSKPIVYNGFHFSDRVDDESLSYVRGTNEKKWVMKQREMTSWIFGYSHIITLLQSKSLQKQCTEVSAVYKDMYGNWDNFYNYMLALRTSSISCFYEIFDVLTEKRQKDIMKKYNNRRLNNALRTISQGVFSIRNSDDKKHKILTLAGIKLSWKRKYKNYFL